MTGTCRRCGIGERASSGDCDWCAAPRRARVPIWILGRRALLRSRVAAWLRERGPLAAAVAAGVTLHLLVAALAVLADLPVLWRMGFFWDAQWWWALVPESVQPWGFALLRGAAYGALAGWAAGWRRAGGVTTAAELCPGSLTALAAYLLSSADGFAGTQHRLVAAALGAGVGRLTSLLLRARGPEARSR
jgi:hypothetical protein